MYFTFRLIFQVCTFVNRIYIIRFIIMIISLAFEAKKYKIYRRNIMYNIINPFLYRYQDKFREMNRTWFQICLVTACPRNISFYVSDNLLAELRFYLKYGNIWFNTSSNHYYHFLSKVQRYEWNWKAIKSPKETYTYDHLPVKLGTLNDFNEHQIVRWICKMED